MRVTEIAYKMLADAQQTLPPNTVNPFYWSVGDGVRRRYFMESVSCDPSEPRIAAIIKAQDEQAWKGDFWLCGIPAFLSEREPNTIRLMMGMQIEVGAVDEGAK